MSDPDYYYKSRISELLSNFDVQELATILTIVRLLYVYREESLPSKTLQFISERINQDASKPHQ